MSALRTRTPSEIDLRSSQILSRFLSTKSRSAQLASVNPLTPGAEESTNKSRVHEYKDQRDQGDKDTTSRLRCVSLKIFKTSILIFAKSLPFGRCDFSEGVHEGCHEIVEAAKGGRRWDQWDWEVVARSR
jgi:hypothetical protein